jgi:hypothetical protein
MEANHVDLYWMTDEEGEGKGGFNITDNVNRVASIMNFLGTHGLKIAGIHLDLETATDYENFTAWLYLLSQIKAVVNTNRTACPTLSAAICSCYNNPDIPNETATEMHKYLDFLVPMTYYCPRPMDFISLINPLISQAPVVIGAGATTYSGYNAMMAVLNTTKAYYDYNSPYSNNCLGFCVFHDFLLNMD